MPMKKYIFTLLYLFIFLNGAAQLSSTSRIDHLLENGHSFKTKNTDSVLLIAQDALQQSQTLQYQFGIAKAYTLASYYYFDHYMYDTARFLLNESLQFFINHPDHQNTSAHGQVFQHMAYVAVREQNLTIARTYAMHALNMFKKHDDTKSILSTLILLGGIESSEGNYAKGLSYYSNVLRIKVALRYPEENCVSDYGNLAAIYIKIGQHEKAILYSRKALELSEKHKYIERQLINLNNLGAAYSALKKYDSALIFYERCVEVSKKNNKHEKKEIAQYNIANLFHKTGDYKKSIELVKAVIALKPSIDVERNANILLANNYFNTGKIDSSITIAVKLYKTFYQYSRNKESTIELTNLLSKAYKAKHKYDSAFYYLNIKQAVTDSIYNQDSQRKLNLLYAELAAIEKEKEIESLEQENLLQKKKNSSRIIILISSSLIIIFLSISVALIFRNKDKREKLISIELTQLLEKKKRDLHQQTLKIIYMNNSLVEMEQSLKKIQFQIDRHQANDIELILQTIRNNKTLDEEWENFTTYFNQVYDQFSQKVDNRFPNLSISERRLILLMKMELKNREIASILNIDTASVKMAKYRLKKKLQLPEDIDIQQYLQNFN